ncbi:MAG: hypothetical protein Ct9H90mP18_10190 [Gammaproteobacteria bacterium]|nr:MAG: hypothetical protein Ct9H90mP18_10190 [Gammaproteobacteria bacterium]
MAAPLKNFIDSTTLIGLRNTLRKVRRSIYSTSSMHGGQETTLMSMFLPFAPWMIIAGVPYSNQNLNSTRTGGTPYGPSHVSFNEKSELSKDEQDICLAYGKRFAI